MGLDRVGSNLYPAVSVEVDVGHHLELFFSILHCLVKVLHGNHYVCGRDIVHGLYFLSNGFSG